MYVAIIGGTPYNVCSLLTFLTKRRVYIKNCYDKL